MSNPDIGRRIMERLASTMDDDAFVKMFSPDGLAETRQWHCEDDTLIEWTTSKVRGGKLDGYWCVFVFEPRGLGARARKKGTATEWQRTKVERCKTRKEMIERREHHYWAHNPKRAAKAGKATS